MKSAVLLAMLLSLTSPSLYAQTSRAATRAEARRLLNEGNGAYRMRAFDKAIELYKQGADLEPAPVFWYNIGQVYRQQGKYDDAIWYYERFLDQPDDDARRLNAERFVLDMKKERDRHAAKETPTNPAPEPVPAVAPPPSLPLPEVEQPRTSPPTVDLSVKPSPPSRALTYAGYGVGAGGIVLVGVGLIMGDRARSLWSETEALCPGEGSPRQCREGAAELHDDATQAATLATVTVSVGLAAVATGVTLLLLDAHGRPARREGVNVTPTVTGTGAGLSLAGGF